MKTKSNLKKARNGMVVKKPTMVTKKRKLSDPLKINKSLKPIKKSYRDGGMTPAMSDKKSKMQPGLPPDYKDFEVSAPAGAVVPTVSNAPRVKNPMGVPPAMRNKKVYKTGGMVNSNTKVKADKTAGSKGVKSGVNPKASKQTTARGRVGGISSAPKTATPKAKYGMSMRKK
jgi:hypothetical protein